MTQHEEAAHERRQWVRLTAQCNNRCLFCLDSGAHDGSNVGAARVAAQLVEGRRRGATRLILSGGEPTIHPQFVELVALGRRLGYRHVQTVTNGRRFSYPEFLQRCVAAGLDEITFSVHGPNARIHDALVGVPGAFDEEMRGLEAALACGRREGRPIVNVDIVINRANVKHLVEMLDRLIAVGVREFDLLQVIPFGRAFHDGLAPLFYDLEEAWPHLQAAFEYAKRPDLHVWLNRFPPQYLEGFESLIQDPHKLHDEVRGRSEEFDALLDGGTPLSCKSPDRCSKCYLAQLCGALDSTIEGIANRGFPIFRARSPQDQPPYPPDALWVIAADLPSARVVAERLPGRELILQLDDYSGLPNELANKRVIRAEAATPAALEQLMSVEGDFAIGVHLDPALSARLLDNPPPAVLARLVLAVENHERVTVAHERAVDLPAFFAALSRLPGSEAAATENIPACLSGRVPRPRPHVLDASLFGPDGRLDAARFTARFIVEGYTTRSRRCRDCVHHAACEGVHINFVRAHGYAPLRPMPFR